MAGRVTACAATNRRQASIFGPIDPAGNVECAAARRCRDARSARPAACRSPASRRHVGEDQQPVGADRDRQQRRGRRPCRPRPPPRAGGRRGPRSPARRRRRRRPRRRRRRAARDRAGCSTMRRRVGGRDDPPPAVPVGGDVQPCRARQLARPARGRSRVRRTWSGRSNAGSSAVDHGLGDQGDDRSLHPGVAQLLRAASSRSCPGSGRPARRAGRAASGCGRLSLSSASSPTCGPLPWTDEQFVVRAPAAPGRAAARGCGGAGSSASGLSPRSQQRVAAEGDDDAHLSPRARRP